MNATLGNLLAATPEIETSRYGWDFAGESAVTLLRDGKPMGTVKTRTPSKTGLMLVDAATACGADTMQVSDHGCGRKSVQLACGENIVADLNV